MLAACSFLPLPASQVLATWSCYMCVCGFQPWAHSHGLTSRPMTYYAQLNFVLLLRGKKLGAVNSAGQTKSQSYIQAMQRVVVIHGRCLDQGKTLIDTSYPRTRMGAISHIIPAPWYAYTHIMCNMQSHLGLFSGYLHSECFGIFSS